MVRDNPKIPRRYSRYPLRVYFTLSSPDEKRHGEILFDTLNISEGGAFLRSEILLEVGTSLALEIENPELRNTPIRAKVAWTTRGKPGSSSPDPGMGIEFVDLPEASRVAIRKLISQHAALNNII
ncbi:MAG: PilZ domain-containing protein [Myxococcota bacterium]|nr:PilZ domain-containing protein [Myxococcota bacterium]